MKSIRWITAHTIGHIARETLSKQSSAFVCGVTSKGIFAITLSRDILFFTDQPYRGPLTINLHGASSILQSLNLDSALSLSPARITFEKEKVDMFISEDIQVWHPRCFSEKAVSLHVLSVRCDAIEMYIESKKDGSISVQLSKQIPALLSNTRSNNIDPLLEALTKFRKPKDNHKCVMSI